jgi:2-polyprenyl-3-methyl-5-hydroxy-6-metoxy-1,4-benzoquinol methylase
MISTEKNKAFEKEFESWISLYKRNIGSSNKRYVIFHGNARKRLFKRIACCIKLLDPKRDHKILDLGCGNGPLRDLVVSKGAQWTGVDVSFNILVSARSYLSSSTGNIDLVNGSIDSLSFKKDMFDSVACIGVINFYSINRLSSFFDEISHVTRRGGKLVFTSLRLDVLTWIRSRIYPKIPLPFSTPGPLYPIHYKKILDILSHSDFRCVKLVHMKKYLNLPHYTVFKLCKI